MRTNSTSRRAVNPDWTAACQAYTTVTVACQAFGDRFVRELPENDYEYDLVDFWALVALARAQQALMGQLFLIPFTVDEAEAQAS